MAVLCVMVWDLAKSMSTEVKKLVCGENPRCNGLIDARNWMISLQADVCRLLCSLPVHA